MKHYKKHNILGLLNNNNDISYYLNYKLYNNRHGFFLSVLFMNKYFFKGYYNMGQKYSHWKNDYNENIYTYYI